MTPRLLAADGPARERSCPTWCRPPPCSVRCSPRRPGRWALSDAVQVVSGTPDILAAAVGSGAVRDYEPHLCVGTSSWLSCHVPFKKTDMLHQMGTLPSALPGPLPARQRAGVRGHLPVLPQGQHPLPGARPAPRTHLRASTERRARARRQRSAPLHALAQRRAQPVDDHSLRGGFVNQSLETTRGHLVRAVLEGVALQLAAGCFGYVEQFVRPHAGLAAHHRRRRPLEAVVPDLRGRARPAHPSGGRARAGQRPGRGLPGGGGAGQLTVDEIPELVPVADTFEPDAEEPRPLRRALPGVPPPLQEQQVPLRAAQPAPECLSAPRDRSQEAQPWRCPSSARTSLYRVPPQLLAVAERYLKDVPLVRDRLDKETARCWPAWRAA